MLAFSWLRKDTPARLRKDEWFKSSAPLTLAEGGSVRALCAADFQAKVLDLESGGSYVGLGCLSWLSNDLSLSGLRIEPARVEGLGRKLWGSQIGEWADKEPIPPNKFTTVTDKYWESNVVQFPRAWPERLTLPVGLGDATSLPAKGKYRLLAMDEAVLSFWLFVEHATNSVKLASDNISKIQAEPEASPGAPEASPRRWDGKTLEQWKERKAHSEAQLQKAAHLQRNVVFSLTVVGQDRLVRALTCREEIDTLREYCGLSGWNRIMVVGQQRDVLRGRGEQHKPEDIANSLKNVVWGPGRQVTSAVAAKCLSIWNRFAGQVDVIETITLGNSLLGGQSPFDEWTKLSIFAGSERPISEIAWAMSSMLHDRVAGKRRENWSREELSKKTSPINIAVLRARAVQGLLAEFADPAVALCSELATARPVMAHTKDALARFKSAHVTFTAYIGQVGADAPWRQALPAWCSVGLGKLMRQLVEGSRDAQLSGHASSPPKGGFAGIGWKELRSGDLEDAVKDIEKRVKEWTDLMRGVSPAFAGGESPQERGGGPAQVKPEAATQASADDKVRSAQEEFAKVAKEIRLAHLAVVPMAGTVLANRAIIESSSVCKKLKAEGAPSVVHVYAVATAWDSKRPADQKRDNRKNRPVPVWKEDLQRFVETVSPLVTAENASSICVLVGRARRPGAGLFVEAGHHAAGQVLEVLNDAQGKDDPRWRVKNVTLRRAAPGVRNVGISAGVSETAFFFFRGAWTAKLKAVSRAHLSGTTIDDHWGLVPDISATFLVPYALQP